MSEVRKKPEGKVTLQVWRRHIFNPTDICVDNKRAVWPCGFLNLLLLRIPNQIQEKKEPIVFSMGPLLAIWANFYNLQMPANANAGARKSAENRDVDQPELPFIRGVGNQDRPRRRVLGLEGQLQPYIQHGRQGGAEHHHKLSASALASP